MEKEPESEFLLLLLSDRGRDRSTGERYLLSEGINWQEINENNVKLLGNEGKI